MQRCRWLLGWVLTCALLSGCTLQIEHYEDGSLFTVEDFERLDIGDDRGAVLRKLGPPNEVRYTLQNEELHYQTAHRSAADLIFVIPTEFVPGFSIVGRIRGVLGLLFPARGREGDIEKDAGINMARSILQIVVGTAGSPGTADLVSLHGRDVRYDRIRVVISRETGLVQRLSYLPANPKEEQLSEE